MQAFDRPVRFGIIGCGRMAQIHARNSRFIAGAELAAYADVDRSRADSFIDQFGGRYACDNANRVIEDPQIDAVIIAIGPQGHAQVGPRAARAGKHIFMEKPIAHDYAAEMRIVSDVRDAGIKFVIGFCNRQAPIVRRAKRLCPDPVITYCQCTQSISADACHRIDLAVHLFHESSLQTVCAVGGQDFPGCEPEHAIDWFAAMLRFENGSVFNYIHHGAAGNPLLNKYHFQLFGRDNTCVYLADKHKAVHLCVNDEVVHSLVFEGPNSSPRTAEPRCDVRGVHGYMGHMEELELFVRIVRDDLDSPMTAEQGAYVLAIEQAIIESAQTGKVIDMAAYMARLDEAAKAEQEVAS